MERFVDAFVHFFTVCFFAFCLFLLAALGYLAYKYAIGEYPEAEYRTFCVKDGGRPLYNGQYWECVK